MPKKRHHNFKSEVHLGLLVIICILLFLNVLSNYIVYRARETVRQDVFSDLTTAALAVRRTICESTPPALSDSCRQRLQQTHSLAALNVTPAGLPDSSADTRRQWLSSVARTVPPKQVSDVVSKLLTSRFARLARAEGAEYFYVYPVAHGRYRSSIILSKNVPQLAFLDDSTRLLLIIQLIALVSLAGTYVLLSRRIFSPFRRMKQEAQAAGRCLPQQPTDADALVEEYRRMIEELQEKEAQLQRLNEATRHRADSLQRFNEYLLSSMNSGIVTVSAEGRIRSMNRAAADVFDLEPADREPVTCGQLLGADSELSRLVARTLATEINSDHLETAFTTQAGRRKTLGVSVSLIRDHEQHAVGASLLVTDLTEIRRLRTELETKNRLAALGEMAGGLAHQLRNSMGAVTGYCYLLKKRLSKKGVETESVDAVVHEAATAEEIINRFLHFARPLHLMVEPVSLADLVEDVVASFQARPRHGPVTISCSVSKQLILPIDPLLVKQALGNIIDNAVNAYHGASGTVEVEAAADRDEAVIRITDYGVGIADEDLDKIFTPFFSSRPSGTGLGLPLARKIVDLHNGSVSVTSQVGKGTTFTLTLPMTRHLGETPPAGTRTPQAVPESGR